MYKTSLRAQRVGQMLHRQLAESFRLHITNEALKTVRISYVDVSPDLKNASVFFFLTEGGELSKDLTTALKKASHFLRKKIATSLNLRVTPQLHFRLDKSHDNAMNLNDIFVKMRGDHAEVGHVSELTDVSEI